MSMWEEEDDELGFSSLEEGSEDDTKEEVQEKKKQEKGKGLRHVKDIQAMLGK